MWGEHEGMGWWMLFGSVWFVLFWGLVIWAVARLFGPRDGYPRDDPMDIARRRYARGEISRDELEQIRRDLQA